ncbi:hypothetical protein V8E51_018210 [Hyaloscypha variabilis]
MARTALSSDAIISLIFGIFMAIIALLALWQTAYYAARNGPDTESVYEPDGQSQRRFPETADLRTTYRRRRSSI